MAEADVLSSTYPAELCAGVLSGAPHLKPVVAKLRESAAELRSHHAKLAALVAAITAGSLPQLGQGHAVARTPKRFAQALP